ncbi:MAG: ATP-binding protein [Oscillospiraceae bacterium]|nr:ATP-binding protein [Oscillospiraceae bacterium]
MRRFIGRLDRFIGRGFGSFVRSVRFRFVVGVLGIVAFFVFMAIVLNTALLKPFYTRQKEKEIEQCFAEIASMDFDDRRYTGRHLRAMESGRNLLILIYYRDAATGKVRLYFSSAEPAPPLFTPADDELGAVWSFEYWINGGGDSVEVFFSKPGEMVSSGPDEAPVLSSFYSGQLSVEYLSLYGRTEAAFHGSAAPFYIIINTSVAAVNESVGIANNFTVFVGLLAAILGGTVVTLFCIRLTDPILLISRTARKMAQLDFSEKLDVKTEDEFGSLASDINHLSGELEQKINELSDANRQLKLDIERKERIDLMRRDFISSVSHDLRTPLSIILGYCEGLQSSGMKAEDREYYCGVIEEEALHMSALTRRLLALAELETGEQELDKTEFDLGEMAASRMQKIGYLTQERNIATSVEVQPGCDFTVEADYDRIEAVINNLMQNAINHTPDGGRISIEVFRGEGEHDGGKVVCRVINSGSFIPEESLPYIWESFYRADKARTRQYGGAGLGLRIVSTIMDMHGEGYGAENTGDGVAFWFTLKAL